MGADQALRAVHTRPPTTGRPYPADAVTPAQPLSEAERRLSGRLLRVDHAGEVAAQGLYQGQALTAHEPKVRERMQRSAEEENDHLAWCDRRIETLGSYTSHLGPLWYLGSYTIGALAGLAGDRWSLGFVRETERQVIRHLDEHLGRLPPQDQESRAILEQMKVDEAHHAYVAERAGAVELPAPVRGLMRLVSKVMTTTAYWI
jgi:ubiquinone biosynthesis monooxygenase Coq7